MRILADHNIEAPLASALRRAGHDVLNVAEALPPETDDETVLAVAHEEKRILLTNDKDFGELAFLQGRASVGLMLLRLAGLDSSAKADRTVAVVSFLGDRLHGAFVVVTESKIRRRPLKAAR